VLLGTGAHQIFPVASFGAQFLRAALALRSWTPARRAVLFNVLVAEHRQVAALLLA